MQYNLDKRRCQELFELDRVMFSHKEDMPVHKSALRLLCHLQCVERLPIDKI